MPARELIIEKIQEVTEEMKQTGLWKKNPPSWVSEFSEVKIATESDFSEWLQFVYIPNLVQQAENRNGSLQKRYVVLQGLSFFEEDAKKGRLLQLLIELDSLL